jgi:hypothetical protein
MGANDELYTPEKREEVKKRNWLSLPRWMRDLRYLVPRKHTHDREDARRRRQIDTWMLNPESRGTVNVK